MKPSSIEYKQEGILKTSGYSFVGDLYLKNANYSFEI